MAVELIPVQAPEVTAAIAAVVIPDEPAPDPWWQAGLDEALET